MIDEPIALVVPTLNQHKLALEMVESFKSVHQTMFFPICNWIHKHSVAKSWNLGIREAVIYGAKYVFVANDDILVSKYAVDAMVEALNKHPEVGLVTGHDYRDDLKHPRDVIDLYPLTQFDPDTGTPDFAFFAIRPEAFYEVGSFDENFTPAYFEDNDYHYRMMQSRWKCARHEGAAFYHYGSTTQNNNGKKVCSAPQFETNRAYYIRKWGGNPTKETFTEPFDGRKQ